MSRGPWKRSVPVTMSVTPIRTAEELPMVCTPVEVGQLMRCTPEYVSRLAAVGVIQGFKLGGRWRFRREDVLGYLEREAARAASAR